LAHLDLPPRDKEQLTRAPLELVVCQVRFQPSELRAERVFAFHAGVKNRLPSLQPAERQTADLSVGPQPAFSTHKDDGWQMTAADGSWTATLMPDSIALQTTKHTTWSAEFEPLFKQLIDALAEHVTPTVELRVGVRYVDRLKEVVDPDPTAWRGRVRDEILGIALHPVLGPAILSSLQQVELEVAENRGCTLKQGAFRDPTRNQASTFFIDTDAFHLEARPFHPDQTRQTVMELHETAVGIFQEIVTHDYLQELKQPE
jgi:uncharacterized protein (TIGR04255 family)